MSPIFEPPPEPIGDQIFCCYFNKTIKFQIVRINNIPNWYFEQVVFPKQRLLFEAVSGAELEIYTRVWDSAMLSEKISCDRLLVSESIHPSLETFKRPKIATSF